MPFEIIRNDITKMRVDAIVNAANGGLRQGGGVCGAIFAAAGAARMQAACDAIGGCATGQSVITPGFALPARYVIHAVGPVWRGGDSDEKRKLASCYTSALQLAAQNECGSIAFPLISSGIFGYPKDQALQVAIDAIGAFLLGYDGDMTVYLVVFDRESYTLGDKLFSAISAYVDDRYVDAHTPRADRRADYAVSVALERDGAAPPNAAPMAAARPGAAYKKPAPRRLADVVAQVDESFSAMLLRLIDEKGKTDVEVYKRANVDRKLFSKIRGNKDYRPSKATAIAFAVALELNLDEAKDLLSRAGYAFSRSSRSDLIIQYFIEEGAYNIFQINEALFAFGESLLGA